VTLAVREILPGTTWTAFDAMLALRPAIATDPDQFARLVDGTLRPQGYRLVGAFIDGAASAAAAAGFRDMTMLAYGRLVYIDDLSTLPSARHRGLGRALLDWIHSEAARLGCEQVHLDSGLGPTRADAHRLYMNAELQISAFHFSGFTRG
jgi:GNAT superfamily N-acetyltransferase